jgi:hypothetical protein
MASALADHHGEGKGSKGKLMANCGPFADVMIKEPLSNGETCSGVFGVFQNWGT